MKEAPSSPQFTEEERENKVIFQGWGGNPGSLLPGLEGSSSSLSAEVGWPAGLPWLWEEKGHYLHQQVGISGRAGREQLRK